MVVKKKKKQEELIRIENVRLALQYSIKTINGLIHSIEESGILEDKQNIPMIETYRYLQKNSDRISLILNGEVIVKGKDNE